jgi:hypothetical protein
VREKRLLRVWRGGSIACREPTLRIIRSNSASVVMLRLILSILSPKQARQLGKVSDSGQMRVCACRTAELDDRAMAHFMLGFGSFAK